MTVNRKGSETGRSEWCSPGGTLNANHLELIKASAISSEVSRARGYRTETVKARLKEHGFAAYQCRVPALLIPLFNVRGERCGYQLRPDEARVVLKNGKALKYETPAGMCMTVDVHPYLSRARLDPNPQSPPLFGSKESDFPSLIADPSIPLVITEGVRKADSAVSIGLCCVAILGVWSWRGSNKAGGKTALADWEDIALNQRSVYIAFDSDIVLKREVYTAMVRLRAFLESRGAAVKIINLPSGNNGQKVGLDDFIAERRAEGAIDQEVQTTLFGLATDRLLSLVDNELESEEQRRPKIFVNQAQLREKVRLALDALVRASDPPYLFCRGGILTRLRQSGDSVELEPLDDAGLLNELSNAADWYRTTAHGDFDADPPANVIRGVRGSRALPFPIIDSVARAPFFTRDGSLVVAPGYHPDARVYLDLPADLAAQLKRRSIPEMPTDQEVNSAIGLLHELFCDFPFADRASRKNALALTLLPFVRNMIDGPTPNHAVDAPAQGQGTGKSLLVQVACVPGLGEIATIPETKEDDELRKFLLAILVEGTSVALLDNRKRNLDSGVLAAVLTAGRWQDRILGKTKTARPTVLTTWVITGNALRVSGEIARRTIWIRLNANRPEPWKRTGFKHVLPQWAHEHRAELIRACVVVVRNWIARGRPDGLRTLGSYEIWSRVMGGILEAAGISDFLAEINEDTERNLNDQDANYWHPFIERWWDLHGDRPVAAKQLLDLANELVPESEKTTERGRETRLGRLLNRSIDQTFAISNLKGSYLRIERATVERRSGGPHQGFALRVLPNRATEVGEVGRTEAAGQNTNDTNGEFSANLLRTRLGEADEVGAQQTRDCEEDSENPPTTPTYWPDFPSLSQGQEKSPPSDADEIEEEI